MARRLAICALALAAFGDAAKKRAASDCSVTSTWPDGRTEERECTIQGDEFLKPATKGKFQSCTR